MPEERDWMQAFIDSGFIDSFRTLHAEPHNYSWWSYRASARNNNKGWRIDYCMLSEPIGNNLLEAGILPNEKHSDHCPVWVKIKR